MPKKLERKLEHEARKDRLKPGSKRYNAYVYGTLARVESAKKHRRAKKKA